MKKTKFILESTFDSVEISLNKMNGLLHYLPREDLEDIVISTNELVINSIKEMMNIKEEFNIEVEIFEDVDYIEIRVIDEGRGVDAYAIESSQLPDFSVEDGRGLFIVSALMDEFDVETLDDKKVYRIKKYLGGNGYAENEND